MTSRSENLLGMVDPGHPLLRLADQIDWPQGDAAGSSPQRARSMYGLHLLKILRGLGDQDLCDQWPENPYFQAFCGETRFCHRLHVEPAELARWRSAIGDASLADWVAKVLPKQTDRPSTFVIDVDGVVATLTPGNDYRLAEPIQAVITAINQLHDRGHTIIMLTARGSMTGMSWDQVTRDQFARWGLKYHDLRFGKPAADYYVDDRMIGIDMMCAMADGRAFPPSTRAPGVVQAHAGPAA